MFSLDGVQKASKQMQKTYGCKGKSLEDVLQNIKEIEAFPVIPDFVAGIPHVYEFIVAKLMPSFTIDRVRQYEGCLYGYSNILNKHGPTVITDLAVRR